MKHYRPPGKKKQGNAARYVTRAQALKHLQVNLSLFRKLCIIKGIFPREPKKKFKGNNYTYYHTKDVNFLLHEPLLERFREIKAYQKKIRKAKAKKNIDHAARLKSREPTYSLAGPIRERYPKFVDALRDLDDCLTMIHLFAALPATKKLGIRTEHIQNCQRLSHEWKAYVARTYKLRKVFVSTKGIYYQAEVEGQRITWLTPHAIQQILPDDVNIRIMLYFLEFYENLLGFVNFKLYDSINVKYPPILDPQMEAFAAQLYALSRYIDANARQAGAKPEVPGSEGTKNATIDGIPSSDDPKMEAENEMPPIKPGALMRMVEDATREIEEDQDTKECKNFFRDMKFFLSREVPKESLLFVIASFGGVASWDGDGAPFGEADPGITHEIVDRPTQGHKYLSREYVQPQWVYDCVNARFILPTKDYAVGRVPPPHLSPFVDNDAEGYVPDYAETIKRLQDSSRNGVLPLPGAQNEDSKDLQNLLAEGSVNRTADQEAIEKQRKVALLEKQYHEELKMEVESYNAPVVKEEHGKVDVEETEDKEEILPDIQQMVDDADTMSTSVMSRKNRGLYEAMKISKERKKARIEKIKERKKKLDGASNP